jgi:DNA-binding NtrC family response regulator
MSESKIYLDLLQKAKKLSKIDLDFHIVGEYGVGKQWFIESITEGKEIEKIDSNEWKTNLHLISHTLPKKIEILHFSSLENLDSEGQLLLNRTLDKRELVYADLYVKIKRLIFTSHPALIKKVETGLFREDLYKKINTIQMTIPPLRERLEDFPYFIETFLELICKKYRKKIPDISEGLLEFLYTRNWEGNLTELRTLLESMILFGKGRTLDKKRIPQNFKTKPVIKTELNVVHGIKLEEYEKEIIKANLIFYDGNRKKTADSLGISERNLYRKIKIYDIEKESIL